MNREEKKAEVQYLSDCFQKSQIAVCADYRGLSVGQITDLRSKLRKAGSFGRVVKNTLAKISVGQVFSEQDSGSLEKFLGLFEGPSLLVFSFEDPIAPTKVMAEFAKEHQALELKGGWLDGEFVDDKGVTALSKMPGREETLAKLLNLMSTPATQLVRLLQAPAQKTVQVLEAQRQKLEGE